MTADIIIEPIREVSDDDAAEEIYAIIIAKRGEVSIAEIAERTCFPFEQIEKIVNYWS